jgi:hypothetical protein
MKTIITKRLFIAAALSALLARPAPAAVSPEEATQLGTTLTEWGAEKAGNADGSIPAYAGGLEKVPGYDPKASPNYVDPFASEKPLYVVDAKNVAQYADLLTEGNKALFRAHPDFRIDVYSTHRTTRYPQWVVQNTLKNATTARLAGDVTGDAMTGADKGNLPFPGVPFPIPKNGYEVMWNYKMHFSPALRRSRSAGYLVDTSGRVTNLPTQELYVVSPWFDSKDAMRQGLYNAFFGFNSTLLEPPSAAGTVFLNFYLPSADNGGQRVWFYTPGQRRVRLAPEFAYDTPIAAYGGVIFWDDICGFAGRLDRFDYKLVGKKEFIVPANVFGITTTLTKTDDYLGPKFVKAGIRFEKRRVWVVDSVRKPSARHSYARRTFYVDEDSWSIVATEAYDNAGKIWRVTHVVPFPTYDVGGTNSDGWVTYDLTKGNYFMDNIGMGHPGRYSRSYATTEGMRLPLTPASVEASGIR